MGDLMLVRSFRSDNRLPADAQERVRARLLELVAAPPASGAFDAPVLSARRRPRRRSSPAVRVAAVALATAAIVLGVLSVLPGSDRSAVARAAAALTGHDGTLLHAFANATISNPDGGTTTWSIETWQQSSPSFDSRQVVTRGGKAVRPETATSAGQREFYDPRTNTIYAFPRQTNPGAPVTKAEAPRGGTGLDPLAPGFSIEKLRSLLTSGDAHEDGRVVVDGRDAIRIVSTSPEMALLVDAGTYEPIEWRVPAGNPPGQAITMRFQTFEWLPANERNAALVSLRAQHPGAALRDAPLEGSEADVGGK